MILFIQFTLSDLRSFSEDRNTLLPKPSWPSPYPFKEFVRGSGQIIERPSGGLNNWIGENFICKIKKGIKFKTIKINGLDLIIRNISKHQYSGEKGVLTKYEFVFRVVGNKNTNVTKSLLERLLDCVLESEVQIRNLKFDYSFSSLTTYSKSLKEFHILTTTKKREFNLKNQLGQIKYCTPQIYIYLDKNETFIPEKKIKHITKTGQFVFRIYSFWKNMNNNPYRVWIHERLTVSSLEDINRSLRISLLRIHSEYECLNNIFRSISDGTLFVKKGTVESDSLQLYISNTITSILKNQEKVQSKIGEQDLIEYFKEIFFQLQPGDYENLINKIKEFDFRPQIEYKTITYIENFHSPQVEIMDSKYKIENSQVGAVGDNAKAEKNTFQQINYETPNDLDYDKLLAELGKLKEHIKLEAQEPEQFEVLKYVAQAEQEAKKKNGNGVVAFLKSGGQWLLDSATKIGVSVVAKLIESNIGL